MNKWVLQNPCQWIVSLHTNTVKSVQLLPVHVGTHLFIKGNGNAQS